MDGSGLGAGFLSGPSGTLDLESSIPRHQEKQLGHPVLALHQHHRNVMSGVGVDHRPVGLVEVKGSIGRGASMNIAKGKAVVPFSPSNAYNLSEEDEPSYTEDGNGDNGEGAKGKKGSTWQRMKWTDRVVRLLISVVALVGDDGVEGGEGLKRKSAALQKKGKWKTVSKIMMSKGCHVSPQQCEDKFNDLNKRYKRLNDILGRGTSCRVVENPTLMDSMPHLSAKAKDDVRKILSSKQLFYKEMCAYHNGQWIPGCHELDLHGQPLPPGRCSTDNNVSEEEVVEEHHDTEDDESDDEDASGSDRDRMGRMGKRSSEEDDQLWQHVSLDTFEVEMAEALQDPTKSLWERREWINKQKLRLQQQRVSCEAEDLELEKQRYKWLRYRCKKDRELERLRLENERMKLENEKRVLQLRQKELEIDVRRSKASAEPSVGIDRLLGRDLDLGKHQ
ncbi:uncharacterized protein LOC126787853 [Argentina anserina]|uniref:uncharacterized protein LOC126787853 n=1 Tax=Argentina anserina TaxID=57926 RepID=UPI0021767473|nr:uncharacterized protein LOC126787853 [Potentilla anserina]XP_050369722.1 uncharacterized protein LOC126787853 [Potentilla anserina]